ncbi:MAG: galactokinase [Brevefilum sp.]
MIDTRKDHIISVYKQQFSSTPEKFVTAPGRINLIGEHTDYSEGFVLPVAIDRDVMIAFSPRQDDRVQVFSMDFDQKLEIDVTNLGKSTSGWMNYIRGMAWALNDAGYRLSGWQGVVSGNIPIGAGLSSSAALEVAAGKTFCEVTNQGISPTQLALLAQKAEKDWVGVSVGIMDQLISAAGKAQHAMLLDCRSLDMDFVPIPEGISFIVLDTLTRRELTHSEYNTRHAEVNQSEQFLGVQSLRDANCDHLQEHHNNMPKVLYRRAKHVISENERVGQFVHAMRNSEITRMGELINASHASLRDDFEVSSDALNLMVELAQNHKQCLGARMMGAGFGGCALAMIQEGDEDAFASEIGLAYQQVSGLTPNIFPVNSVSGVRAEPFINPE